MIDFSGSGAAMIAARISGSIFWPSVVSFTSSASSVSLGSLVIAEQRVDLLPDLALSYLKFLQNRHFDISYMFLFPDLAARPTPGEDQ